MTKYVTIKTHSQDLKPGDKVLVDWLKTPVTVLQNMGFSKVKFEQKDGTKFVAIQKYFDRVVTKFSDVH